MRLRFSHLLLLLVFSSLLFRLLVSPSIYSGDLNNHVGWARSILSLGFTGAYDREYVGIMQPTYPPLSLYAFTTSTGLYNLTYKFSQVLNSNLPLFPSNLIWLIEDQDVLPAFNKIITIVSDIGVGILIYKLIALFRPDNPRLALLASAAYLYNPAVWYTSSIWGQIESFPLFFILLSFWFVFTKDPLLAHASFIGALLSKQSAIIFIPVFLLLSHSRFGLKKIITGLVLQLCLFYMAFLPFINSSNPFWPISVYLHRIQVGSGSNWITDHAFNPWVWITHLKKIPDTTPILFGIPASYIGIFALGSSVGWLLLLYHQSQKTAVNTFLLSALIPLMSFLLLTKMHERYLAPALPFLVLSAALSSSLLWPVYLAVSLVHLANLYHNWWYPRIPSLVTFLSQNSTINLLIVTLLASTCLTLYSYVKES